MTVQINQNTQLSYEAAGNPVVSVDTKKKELIGNLSRDGKIYTNETIEVFDHDFPSLAEGVAIPHTVYDTVQNKAYVTIGTSRDTVNLPATLFASGGIIMANCFTLMQFPYSC